MDDGALLDGLRHRDRRVLGRLLTRLEADDPGADALWLAAHKQASQAWRVALTGPPGVGKSTLAAALAAALRARGLTVGLLAVDPTSPITGGALLGDRIRMRHLALDQGVFLRSLADRGHGGGIARAAERMADALDAFGFEVLLVETVGVGQSEHAAAAFTDRLWLVLHPRAGDAVQDLKAGLLDLADLVVLNRADDPLAEEFRARLADHLSLRQAGKPAPAILPAVATTGEGVEALAQLLADERAARPQGPDFERRDLQVRRLLRDRALAILSRGFDHDTVKRHIDALCEALRRDQGDFARAADDLADALAASRLNRPR